MKLPSLFKPGAITLLLMSGYGHATGVVPETSVVIVDQGDGEGVINLKNTDTFPVLLLTTLINIPGEADIQLSITPPAARVEPGKSQSVRFILANSEPLKTEHLKRVVFEGVPPQQKDKNKVRMTVRQNLPVLIRPAGLAKNTAPWKLLVWKMSADGLQVSNPSPYVVRLSQNIQTLPDNTQWTLPEAYVLPGQNLTLEAQKKPVAASQVRISPATTWGYSVDSYNAPLTQ
ncbi:fimbria/pilus chaperone family protein [Serratia quinivorans]|uniref:fimbria/pilus chaperone family protein n=1 Tax=Serratia quinivorans TaxID=137545 RepID=UPI001C480F39|nr:fimbria/pilus chaperone family protein [Serratia quinivorans]MBV6693996.1 fimbria/pilus periplasmic chaperone [Serratia quinivorans]